MSNLHLDADAMEEGFKEVSQWISQICQQWDNSRNIYYLPYICSVVTDFYQQYQDTMAENPNSLLMDSIERVSNTCFILGWLYRDRPEDFETLFQQLEAKYGTK